MSVTRINEFRAKEGQGKALLELLHSFVPPIVTAAGCQSYQVLRNLEDDTKVVVIEVWDSVEAHKASVQKIPVHALETAMKLVDGPPKGEYYHP